MWLEKLSHVCIGKHFRLKNFLFDNPCGFIHFSSFILLLQYFGCKDSQQNQPAWMPDSRLQNNSQIKLKLEWWIWDEKCSTIAWKQFSWFCLNGVNNRRLFSARMTTKKSTLDEPVMYPTQECEIRNRSWELAHRSIESGLPFNQVSNPLNWT